MGDQDFHQALPEYARPSVTRCQGYRAERLSEFVGAVIAGNSIAAKGLIASLNEYPIAVTRDLPQARHWLRQRRRGTERAGLLASSNGLRLKSHGVFVRAKVDPAQWFLAPRDDVRSSDALENAATEFEVQGLELDWACVCWDANLRQGPHGWESFKFVGTRWQQIRDEARKSFLPNSYRVLLTPKDTAHLPSQALAGLLAQNAADKEQGRQS